MNRTLYVGNLPLVAEENQLRVLFGADGRKVASVKIPMNKHTGRTRGYAFIEMENEEDARRAIDALHGHEFLGRSLNVDEARGPSDPSDHTRSGTLQENEDFDQRRARIRAFRSGDKH